MLGSLKGIAKKDDEKALRKVAQEFEGLLLNQVMKSMRNASFGDDMFESDTTRTFTGMLDQQFAKQFSGRPGGLAEVVVNPLPRERSRASLHHLDGYYELRNHVVDFLVSRARAH